MIRCDNLVKIYKTTEVEVMALQGLDLTVDRGEMIGVVGSSGSGKSTLLNMLGGLDKPTAGSLFIDGRDMVNYTNKDLIRYKRDVVGFVWQNNARNLLPYLTARQNVEMPLLLSDFGGSAAKRRERALLLLEMVGLSGRKDSTLGMLSGGEQQRVAIAIALANQPRLLLADEPTGAVDSRTAAMILEIFRDLNRRVGVTIIIVTHDVKLSRNIDRVVAIRDGKTSSELVRRHIKLEDLMSLSELSHLSDEQKHEALQTAKNNQTHEELAVLDRAGRLQIPKAYMQELGIKGGDKVQLRIQNSEFIIIEKPR